MFFIQKRYFYCADDLIAKLYIWKVIRKINDCTW